MMHFPIINIFEIAPWQPHAVIPVPVLLMFCCGVFPDLAKKPQRKTTKKNKREWSWQSVSNVSLMCSAHASALNYSSSRRGCPSAISMGLHLCIFGGATAYALQMFAALPHKPTFAPPHVWVQISVIYWCSLANVSVWYSAPRAGNLPWAHLLSCVAWRLTFLIIWFFSHLSDKIIQTFKSVYLRWKIDAAQKWR